MMNYSTSEPTTRCIQFENCQVIMERQQQQKHVDTNSPPRPAVSVTSEVSIVSSSSDESSCGEVHLTHVSKGIPMEMKQEARKRTVSIGGGRPFQLLAAQPRHDKGNLHPLHAFIRQQIEVFTVEKTDMDQPAPGRKNPIRLHQVGLRCIHCRDMPLKAKRAVCYPTSVGRVYHAVSDMKFDHFGRCTGLPEHVRATLQQLRENQKSTSESSTTKKKKRNKSIPMASFTSTAQYYHDAAVSMGMRNRNGGVYLDQQDWSLQEKDDIRTDPHLLYQDDEPPSKRARTAMAAEPLRDCLFRNQGTSVFKNAKNSPTVHLPRFNQALSPACKAHVNPGEEKPKTLQVKLPLPLQNHTNVPTTINQSHTLLPKLTRHDAILLSSPQDEHHLNDIHCFIRKQVEVFSATRSDVNAPAPGRRKRIVLGQVGIRCIHCAFLPAQNRFKRSVCYPPSMKGIYHAVSNMKFDHFTICQHLPTDIKDRFDQLYSSENRKSTRGRGSKGTSRFSPMGQFYVESASTLGLMDTETGIRFQPKTKVHPTQFHGMTGMSALMIAATDPNLREAYFLDKETSLKDDKL